MIENIRKRLSPCLVPKHHNELGTFVNKKRNAQPAHSQEYWNLSASVYAYSS